MKIAEQEGALSEVQRTTYWRVRVLEQAVMPSTVRLDGLHEKALLGLPCQGWHSHDEMCSLHIELHNCCCGEDVRTYQSDIWSAGKRLNDSRSVSI